MNGKEQLMAILAACAALVCMTFFVTRCSDNDLARWELRAEQSKLEQKLEKEPR